MTDEPDIQTSRILKQTMRDPETAPSRLARIRGESTWTDMAEGQLQHLGITVLMVAGAFTMLYRGDSPPKLLGLTAAGWGEISIMFAVIHQVVVAAVFRLQLHRNVLTKTFGSRDMDVWAAIFLPLLALRPLTLILTGAADTHDILGSRVVEWVIGFTLIAVAVWAMHSVIVHFTIRRALGGDHFREDIAAMPMVDKGAFAYTSNAMYGVVFLGLWGIAIAFGSWNALVVALFQHAYIWVHMYCTEKPDMEWIYGHRQG